MRFEEFVEEENAKYYIELGAGRLEMGVASDEYVRTITVRFRTGECNYEIEDRVEYRDGRKGSTRLCANFTPEIVDAWFEKADVIERNVRNVGVKEVIADIINVLNDLIALCGIEEDY